MCIVLTFPLQFHELASWIGDPPKEGLAKYGYKSYKQVDFFGNLVLCSGDLQRTYNLNMANPIIFFLKKCGEFG
jgi:hypothetical protein